MSYRLFGWVQSGIHQEQLKEKKIFKNKFPNLSNDKVNILFNCNLTEKEIKTIAKEEYSLELIKKLIDILSQTLLSENEKNRLVNIAILEN